MKEIASKGPEGQASTPIPDGYSKDDTSGDMAFKEHITSLVPV